MLLKEYLNKLNKAILVAYAYDLGLSKCANLRKADLINLIVEKFCSPDELRKRLTCLTKEQLDLFRKASVVPQELTIFNAKDTDYLEGYWFGSVGLFDEKFYTFEEVANVYSNIDDAEFRLEQNRRGWLMKCLRFFNDYYGIAQWKSFMKCIS